MGSQITFDSRDGRWLSRGREYETEDVEWKQVGYLQVEITTASNRAQTDR